MKTLVVYYSYDGNSEFIANKIAKQTNADVLRLKPINEKKSKGFSKFVWGGSQVFMKAKPELEEYSINLDEYDQIFIGTPVWAGTYAPALNTFFNDNKIENKKIALYCCYSGSISKTFTKMKQVLVNNEIIGEIGFIDPYTKGNDEEVNQQIEEWIKNIK